MSLFTANPNTGLREKCTPKKGFRPSIIPVIFNLSTNTSKAGKYQVINITGENFRYNNTQVNFGNISNILISLRNSIIH